MIFRYTGAGWLGLVLPALTFVGGVVLVDAVGLDLSPAAGLVLMATLLVGGLVHWLVAAALNSERTRAGRVWHDAHTLQGAPLQRVAGFYVLAAAAIGCVVLGALTAPVVGVAAFLGLCAVGLALLLRHLLRVGADGYGLARGVAAALFIPFVLVSAGLADATSPVLGWGLFALVAGPVYLALFREHR